MPERFRWLIWLAVAEIATMLTFGNYSAALPVLREEWGLSAAQAGAVFAGQQIGYTAAVLVLSTLTDVIGVCSIYLASALWAGAFGLRGDGHDPGAVWREEHAGNRWVRVGLDRARSPGRRDLLRPDHVRRAVAVHSDCASRTAHSACNSVRTEWCSMIQTG
jgi:hypothetical protein